MRDTRLLYFLSGSPDRFVQNTRNLTDDYYDYDGGLRYNHRPRNCRWEFFAPKHNDQQSESKDSLESYLHVPRAFISAFTCRAMAAEARELHVRLIRFYARLREQDEKWKSLLKKADGRLEVLDEQAKQYRHIKR